MNDRAQGQRHLEPIACAGTSEVYRRDRSVVCRTNGTRLWHESKSVHPSGYPGGPRHSLRQTIVQVRGLGPWAISYVNPGDDPRKK